MEYKSVNEGMEKRGSTFTSTDAQCSLYTLFINVGEVKLHPGFANYIRQHITHLSSRDEATHLTAADDLVKEFGSHFPSEVVMGSRYGEVLEIAQQYVQASSSASIAADARTSINLLLSSGSVSASFKSDNGQSSQFSSNITSRYVHSVGSTPPANGDASSWASQSIQNPAVIGLHKMKPITDLLTRQYFPDIPLSILNDAKEFIADYLNNRCPGCAPFLDDYDICFGGMLVNTINTLTKTKGCLPNYVMSDPLISENNMWGLRSLHYCYHKDRCKYRVSTPSPKESTEETMDYTSFGGMFSRLIYYASTNGDLSANNVHSERESGHEINLLSYLTIDGVPILDDREQGRWTVFTQEDPTRWLDELQTNLPYSSSTYSNGHWEYNFVDDNHIFFRPFDDIRYRTVDRTDPNKPKYSDPVRQLIRSQFNLTGNALNHGKSSCSSGFVELFLGVFYSLRGQESSCGSCNRRRNAHAALFICVAADKTDAMLERAIYKGRTMPGSNAYLKAGGMPVSSLECASAYSAETAAETESYIKKLLIKCGDVARHTYFNPHLRGSLPSTAHKPVSNIDPAIDIDFVAYVHKDGVDFEIKEPSAPSSVTYVHEVLVGGDYKPIEGASIGGVFARGDDLSLIIPPRPEYPYNKLYNSAGVNYLFHSSPGCPPGYREHVLFTTKSLHYAAHFDGGNEIPEQEWFHIGGTSAEVIMCLLASRTAYETATLSASAALSAVSVNPAPLIAQSMPFLSHTSSFSTSNSRSAAMITNNPPAPTIILPWNIDNDSTNTTIANATAIPP